MLGEVSQSINDNDTVNGLPIDEAKAQWDLAKEKKGEVLTQIQKLEGQYESNLEKLKHLTKLSLFLNAIDQPQAGHTL